MKRYSQHQIEALLDKFMDGQTTVEEEAQLADYFRSHDVPAEWEDYRDMFGYFDRGMEGDLLPVQQPQASLTRLMGRRWWGIGAAAAITALIVGTAVLQRPATTNDTPSPAIVKSEKVDTPITVVPEVETQHLTVSSPPKAAVRSKVSSTASHSHRLQAENKRLAEENERLQRELADLKRRSFIIDLEANGYKTVLNEDGNIVLIDMEQEIENELNNQPTTNIPAL